MKKQESTATPAAQQSRHTAYYHLIKPGIIRGNLMIAVGAFLFGSMRSIDVAALISMVIGLGGIIAAGCVFNNILDRKIDAKMKRTEQRALVTGRISVANALLFASALTIVGIVSLLIGTTSVALITALMGLVLYVIVYGVAKRQSVHGTLVGALSGAVPPVVGYTAATGAIDSNAVMLFFILVVWQMPHFYAIAMFRAKEYAAANIPVITVRKSMRSARIQILAYIVLFTLLTPVLSIYGSAGITYAVIMTLMSVFWLGQGINKYKMYDDIKWGKMMFGYSLLALTLFAALIAIDIWLP